MSALHTRMASALLDAPFMERGRALLALIERSPLAARLARGSFWALGGSIIARVLGLLSAVLSARILGQASYGELGIIQSTVGMFGLLAGFGMGTTATKFIAELRTKDPAKAGRIIVLASLISWISGLFLAVGLFFTAHWVCTNSLAAPHLTPAVQLGSLILLLGAVNGAQNGALSGFEAFRSIAKINFLTGVLNFPFVIGGAMLWGLMGVVGGLVLTQAIGCLLSYFALRHEASRSHIPLSLSGWTAELPVLWHFSTPVVLGSLLMAPATWIASALLARQPQGYEQMGIYNAANQVFNALLWLPFVLSQVVLPLLSERFGVKDQRRSTKLLLTSIGINACVVFPLVIIFGLGSPYIMSAFGKNYAPEWPTLIATLITAGLVAVQIPIGNVIAASGRMWLGLSMNLAWCITFIGGTWLMLRLGSLGLAYGRLLAYLVQGAWSLIFTLTAIRKLGNSDENLAAAQVSSKDR